MIRFLVLALSLISASAFAEGGSSVHNILSERITCRQAISVVKAKGAVVFFYGRDLSLYNRVVYHGGFCGIGEQTRPVQAPTRDTDACDVGYVCEANTNGGGGDSGGNQ